MENTQTALEPIQKMPSYELLTLTYEHIQDIMMISSPKGRVEYISPSVQKILGYKQEEILGTFIYEKFHKEDLAKIMNSDFPENVDEDTFECRVIHKDGHCIWIETTIKVIRNNHGGVVNLIGIGRNISERKHAEEQMVKAKEQSESFIENTADAIWVVDLEDIVLDVNPSFERMFGWSAEDVKGEKLPIIPDGLKESMTMYHQRIKLGETVAGLETTRLKKDGQLLNVEATLSPIRNRSGSIIGITGICRDVTEKKQVEEELREKTSLLESFIENHLDAIIIFNQQGIVNRVNKTFEKVFGWSEGEIRGLQLLKLPFIPEEYVGQAHELLKQVESGESVIDVETVRKNKNGERLNVNLTIFPILAQEGNVKGWSVTLRDITEWKKTQQHLQQSEKLSVAGQLAAGIAHEIRNPMTAIKGFIQLMKADSNGKETYFEIIASEVERIELILSELLVLAKPQCVKYEKKDMLALISQVTTLLESQAIMKNIQFITDFEAGVPPILCDENQLKQVFINFIKNSIESMPNGGNITIQVNKENDQEMMIRLIDQGCGITKEVLARLGEPFYTTKEKGTGLGFMVSKKIIENHSGKINVSSELNKGTQIEIKMPIN